MAGYVSQLLRLRLGHVRAIEDIDRQLTEARGTLAKSAGWTAVSHDTAGDTTVDVVREIAHVDTVVASQANGRRRYFSRRLARAAEAAAADPVDPDAPVERNDVLGVIRASGPVTAYQIALALRSTPGRVWPKLYLLEKEHAIARDTTSKVGPHRFSVVCATPVAPPRRSCARCYNLFDAKEGVHCARCALVEADERRERLRAFTRAQV